MGGVGVSASRTDPSYRGRGRRGPAILVAVAVVLAAGYGLGNTLGRAATEPAQPQPGGVGHAPAVATEPTLPPDSGPDEETVEPAVRPPAGAGPYGTSRVTGADFVALTFDDGPDPRWTPEVLALLREHGVTATFCVLGESAAAHPDLVREIAADGHTLCNHSWDHDNRLGSRSAAVIRADLERTNAAIRAAAPDAPISYYRQPGGMWTERVVAVAAELGMASLHWAVDPQDWRPVSARVIAQALLASPPGAIVLLHDGGGERAATVNALRLALPDLVSQHRLTALPPDPDPYHSASDQT